MKEVPRKWKWFNQARFGLFIHFGPYAQYGRGEQILFREHLDQADYIRRAAAWKAPKFDADAWADCAKRAGMKYAVLTTRHHDGYCLWDSRLTDYTSVAQAARCDFVAEFLRAFRKAGLRVGLYYSLADWRIPAYWAGPRQDPQGWKHFRNHVHGQVRELLTRYGKIDMLWFDGAWPHSSTVWRSKALVEMIRSLQPEILINNRLGTDTVDPATGGTTKLLGDYGTPEHEVRAENRLWESCQTSTWRLWGYTRGERWKSTDQILDLLVVCASQGGNLLLNVGPKPDGSLPAPFLRRMEDIGRWMKTHGEAIYGSQAGEVCEFVSYGWQTRRDNILYLVIRFWDARRTLHLAGLETPVRKATLLTTGQSLEVRQEGPHLYLSGLPAKSPTRLFPVIKLACTQPPKAAGWAQDRLWTGDPARMLSWAKASGKEIMNTKMSANRARCSEG